MVDYREFNDHRDRMGTHVHNSGSGIGAGPLLGLIAVVAILAAVFIFASGGSDETGSAATNSAAPAATDPAAPAATPVPAPTE